MPKTLATALMDTYIKRFQKIIHTYISMHLWSLRSIIINIIMHGQIIIIIFTLTWVKFIFGEYFCGDLGRAL